MIEIPEQLKGKAKFILVQKKGKIAAEKNWQNTNNYDWNDLRFNNWLVEGGNYGVLPKEDLCILDIDEPNKLNGNLDMFKDTFTVKTSKGFHFYMLVKDSSGKKIPFYSKDNKEQLGEFYPSDCAGYCIGPNSIHPTGIIYEVVNDTCLKEFTIDELNNKFFSTVLTSDKKETAKKKQLDIRKNDNIDWVSPAEEGSRNDRLTRIAGSLLFNQKIPLQIAILTLQNWNATNCKPPLDSNEVITIANSVYKMELGNNSRFESFTELGNAKKFIKKYKDELLFDTQRKKWIFWNGKKWEYDDTLDIVRKFYSLLEDMKKDAEYIDDDKLLSKYLTHISKSQSKNCIQGSLKNASALVPVKNSELNKNPFLFNMNNGILDLPNMVLHKHDKTFLLTQLTKVDYKPEQTCPMWIDFLNKIFNENDSIIEFIQRALGYSLSGVTSERCVFILYGSGKNGKTVFLETIAKIIFGDYARRTSSETFMKQPNSGMIRNDIARLQGARFVYAGEGNESRKLDEGIVKEITGGDKVSARFLYEEWFEFKPEFKIWFATNHKPVITGSDSAIWRRIKLIPFLVTIKDEEEIAQETLYSNFEQEKEGIFNWIYEGFIKWYNEGFNECKEIDNEVKQYREDMDYLEMFVQECCDTSNPHATISVKQLYEMFVLWWTDEELNLYKPISKKAFSMKMQDRGIERIHDGKDRKFKGIQIKVN